MFREFREIARLVGPNKKSAKSRSSRDETKSRDFGAITSQFTGSFRFLDLPPEVRAKVYEQLFCGVSITIHGSESAKVTLNDQFNLHMLRTCQDIRSEALPALIASCTLHLLDKRPYHLLRPIPDYYLRGIRRLYLLPRLNDPLDISDFPSLQVLLIFMSREELFMEPKPSAEDYEDTLEYPDADLIADARAGLLQSGRCPEWLLSEVEMPRAERGYSIIMSCTVWHKKVGNHLDIEIKLDGGELDTVARKVRTWTSSTERDENLDSYL